MLLKGKITRLRALEPEDLHHIYRWENNTSVWRFGETLTPFSQYILKQYLQEAHKDIFEAKQLRLVIETCDENSIPVGTIDLFNYDPFHNRAGVGILIDDAEQRNGYAEDALRTLSEYCFDYLQMNQLYSHITTDNEKSIGLFTKCGFEHCGLLKNWYKSKDGYLDQVILQLLKN